MARFSMSVVIDGPETVPTMFRRLAYRFLQNTWQRRLIFECVSIIKCLIMQFLSLNSSDRCLTRFYGGCICVYSSLGSWPDREVPHQNA
jgi:hypothetical protein